MCLRWRCDNNHESVRMRPPGPRAGTHSAPCGATGVRRVAADKRPGAGLMHKARGCGSGWRVGCGRARLTPRAVCSIRVGRAAAVRSGMSAPSSPSLHALPRTSGQNAVPHRAMSDRRRGHPARCGRMRGMRPNAPPGFIWARRCSRDFCSAYSGHSYPG